MLGIVHGAAYVGSYLCMKKAGLTMRADMSCYFSNKERLKCAPPTNCTNRDQRPENISEPRWRKIYVKQMCERWKKFSICLLVFWCEVSASRTRCGLTLFVIALLLSNTYSVSKFRKNSVRLHIFSQIIHGRHGNTYLYSLSAKGNI